MTGTTDGQFTDAELDEIIEASRLGQAITPRWPPGPDWLKLVVWLILIASCVAFWIGLGWLLVGCEPEIQPAHLGGAVQLAGFDGLAETHWQLAELNYLEALRLGELHGDSAMVSKAAGNVGGIRLDHGDLATASLWLRRAAAADPENREARTNLATVLLLQARTDTVEARRLQAREHAVVLYRWVLERYPNYGPAWTNLGVALVESGQREPAQRAYARALELDPGDRHARANLALLEGAM